MNIKRTILLLILLVVLSLNRFAQMTYAEEWASQISQINIDLSQSSKNSGEFYEKLDGEWIWFEEKILNPNEISKMTHSEGKKVSLPSSFESLSGKKNSYATYSTTVKIPKEYVGKLLSIHIPYQYSAYVFFVNDIEIARNGVVGSDKYTHEAEMAPRLGQFIPKSEAIQLTIQISSFNHIRGGVENSINIGEEAVVTEKYNSSMIVTLFINGCLFIIGIFMVLFSLFRRSESLFLFFGLFSTLISVRAVFSVPFYYTVIFLSMDWLWGTRLEYILTEATSMFYIILLWKWHEEEFSKKIIYIITSIHILLIVTTLFTQPVFFQKLFFTAFYLAITIFIYVIFVIFRSIRNNNRYARVNLFGMGLIFLAFFNDFAIGQNFYQGVPLMLPAVGCYVVIHVVLMSKNFADARNKIEEQYYELLKLNESNQVLASQLQNEMKQKDEFLTNTSHELKNPLHGIINIAQSLLNRSDSSWDEQTKHDLQLQLTIARHMSWTLEDLLELARLKEHRITLNRKSTSLQAVAVGVVNMLSMHIENKRISLEVNIDEQFPKIYADHKRLIQILFNLVHNAIKYTESGKISISGEIIDDYAHIYVSDTGIGMSHEAMQTIFEPYTQANINSVTKAEGFGLGLSICKQLVLLHEGTIGVKSKQGEGTVFTITLPLAHEEENTTETTMVEVELSSKYTAVSLNTIDLSINNRVTDNLTSSYPRSTRPKILAVDDNPINLHVLRHILSSDQYDLEYMSSAKDVLEQIEWKKWDLIISDVMMPGISGYDLTKAIRKKYSRSELPIILLTARSNPDDIYTGLMAGANDYVTKPVDALELNVRVQALTDLQASIEERLKMEAAWLHAQIRPHFLLNTLNSIISLSQIDANRMYKLLDKFTLYLQSSFYLKNLEKEVELTTEIELIEAYIYIEKERFEDRLNVIWDVDDVGSIKIPPLVMQTLVENAVNHGVLMRKEGGTVHISIKKQTDKITVSIVDDGVGMSEQTLAKLFETEGTSRQGIGIVNANQRLKRLYGQGLTIESETNKGTKAIFSIPIK